MSLIKCKNCNENINIMTRYCGKCGNKNKKRKFVFIGIILIIIIFLAIILSKVFFSNQSYYSKNEINNIQLKQDIILLFRENGLDEQIVINYVKDCMEQYNFAFKNEKIMELTDVGNEFINYFNDDFEAKYQDEFTDVILDFIQIATTNARYIVNELPIEITLGEEFSENLVIDEKYYEYKDVMKKEIDTILQNYFIEE